MKHKVSYNQALSCLFDSSSSHPFEGAIFDCDGTLLDTLYAWRDLEHAIADASQGASLVTDADRAHLVTCTVPETAAYLHQTLGFLDSSAAVEAFMDDFLIRYYVEQATLFAGVYSFLDACKVHGVHMAVASSSRHAYLEAGLRGAGIADFFDHVVSVDDVGLSKRDPRFFKAVAQTLGTTPSTTWVFDDAAYALEAAHRAGFPTVAILGGEQDLHTVEGTDEAIATLEVTGFYDV